MGGAVKAAEVLVAVGPLPGDGKPEALGRFESTSECGEGAPLFKKGW